jgi:putative flavoprotein involved in K+ transport
MTEPEFDVLVIGGGQAGLAAGFHLQRQRLGFTVLESGPEAVGSWPAYYDSLTLFSPARYSALPGLPFPGDPEHYPVRDEVVDYLRAYANHFSIPILPRTHVAASCARRTVRSAPSVLMGGASRREA